MPSDDRLIRKRLGNNEPLAQDTLEDDDEIYRDGDTAKTAITLGLAALGISKLYKSGALKDIVKPILEYADVIAKNGVDNASVYTEAVYKWSKLKHLSPDEFENAKQLYNPPEHSMFRGNTKSLLSSLVNDTYGSMKRGEFNYRRTMKIIDDSVEDVNLMSEVVNKTRKLKDINRTKYDETELVKKIKNINYTLKDIENNMPHQAMDANFIMSGEFIKEQSLSAANEAKQLKRSGYRNLMLKDVIEKPFKDDSGRLVFKMKENSPINLNDAENDNFKGTIGTIERFFADPTRRYRAEDGQLKNILADWENSGRLIIDKGIMINESGKVIDTRMSRQTLKDFKHSLVTDFQIPVLNFNPLSSLTNWGRTAEEPFAGIIKGTQKDGVITGKVGKTVADKYGGDIVVINRKAYKAGEGNFLEQVDDGIILNDITNADNIGFSKKIDTKRKIENLSTRQHVKYTEEELEQLSPMKRFYYKMSQKFDFGWQEYKNNEDLDTMADGTKIKKKKDLGYYLNIDDMTTDAIYKATDKIPKPNSDKVIETANKEIFGKGMESVTSKTGKVRNPRTYTATRKGITFKDVMSKNGEEASQKFGDYLGQFFAGRDKYGNVSKNFTERSGMAYGLLDALDMRASKISPLLGLSLDSKGSFGSLLANLMAKRVLPIYAATQVPGVLNMLSEPIFSLMGANDKEDETGNKMNLGKFIMSNVVKPIDLGMHVVKDTLGITKVAKGLDEFMPGFENINELPGVYQLGLAQTTEERKEYMESGMDPVRKGRYWSTGNTPYIGGKIMYYRPNAYRRVQADVDFSDSKWGSRFEYYTSFLDPYHYDKKHYYDRPYLETSPLGSNIPLVGPLFSSTIGQILKPVQKMHTEYWTNNERRRTEDANSILITGEYNKQTYQTAMDTTQAAAYSDMQARQGSINTSKQIIASSVGDRSGIVFETRNILPRESVDTTANQFELYATPSGNMQVVDIPSTMNLYEANTNLKKYSIKKIIESDTRVNPEELNQFNPKIAEYNNPVINDTFVYGLGEQYNLLSQVAGMKGFEAQTFITGAANENATIIENSNYAYSFNKEFWDQNLGGFGGDASEIFRRFVQKRNNNTEYINPIRNTMPDWMPGSDYFTNFKIGDSYSKVDNGEERLPGEGYERLWNIDNLFDLGIGSSFIGKTTEEMTLHLLNKDQILDDFGKEVTEAGNIAHKQIEQEWMDAGLAIQTEGKIEDKQNNILGFYDAQLRDITSATGLAIADIKTVGDKKFNAIKEEGEPLYEHRSQVNYYLWATGNTEGKGYIYYVNRDNPEERLTYEFQFDRSLLEENLNNLKEARSNIYSALQNGEIGRGDLYDDVDKFRILADVAPYSEEYRRINATLARRNDLTTEEQEEISQIKQRVREQKEPLIVHDYKFKTSNLQYEDVTVKQVIDNNTIIVNRYGTDHAIKFAGINVSQNKTEKYDSERTMNDAAADELKKYIRKGKKITIGYDKDDANKFRKDSTDSIRSVIYAGNTNVNKRLLDKGVATEKENDDSPAAINARYSKGEIAFGSAMERITHFIGNNVPIIGSKIMQVRSPYEQYEKKEVYGKDFQSWSRPVQDFLVPTMEESIHKDGIGGVLLGAFIGSLFGAKGSTYGKLVGTLTGAAVPIIGKAVATTQREKGREWIPERRQKQREINEYMDMLKYVKNIKLYNEYKEKALKEDKFDVDRYTGSKESKGDVNKLRQRELDDFKKTVKLDFKHRNDYNFKYGVPKYVDMSADKKTIISQINQEMTELQSDRTISRLPENALKAIAYKQQAEETMYGYDQGDPLQNLMKALPKKDRQYFGYFVDAPEEEKQKILQIVPEYMRRPLQSSWGMEVDEKPDLIEYFESHGLPGQDWIGWNEESNLEDVKVQLVHQEKLDFGEFDIWDDQIDSANMNQISTPILNKTNNTNVVKMRLQNILTRAGYNDVAVMSTSNMRGNKSEFTIYQDRRDDLSEQIKNMSIS